MPYTPTCVHAGARVGMCASLQGAALIQAHACAPRGLCHGKRFRAHLAIQFAHVHAWRPACMHVSCVCATCAPCASAHHVVGVTGGAAGVLVVEVQPLHKRLKRAVGPHPAREALHSTTYSTAQMPGRTASIGHNGWSCLSRQGRRASRQRPSQHACVCGSQAQPFLDRRRPCWPQRTTRRPHAQPTLYCTAQQDPRMHAGQVAVPDRP